MLKKNIGVKGIKANINKRIASCNTVNAIRGKYLKVLISINKGKKYNSIIFKNKGNRTKRLAI